MPDVPSTASRNWPMTSSTGWIRIIDQMRELFIWCFFRPQYLACASNDGIHWNSQYGAPPADSADASPHGFDSVIHMYFMLLSNVNCACRAYQNRTCFRNQAAALADGSGDKHTSHPPRAGVTRPNTVLRWILLNTSNTLPWVNYIIIKSTLWISNV